MNTQSEMGLHYYGNCTKSSKTKVADEEPLTDIQHEIFTLSNQSCGRPCFTPLRDGRQTGSATRHSGEMQEQKEPQI